MTSMKIIQQMVLMYAQGRNISDIAQALGVDRKTVRKFVQQEDFSEPFPQPSARATKLDPFKPTIQAWLAEDARVRYKQRHTAVRVHHRLKAEFPDTYTGSYSAVQRYVKQIRPKRPRAETGTLE